MSDLLKQLHVWFDHMAWADQHAIQALRRSAGQPSQALDIFAHILGAEHVWLMRLLGKPAEVAVWPALSVDDCALLAMTNASAFTSYLRSLRASDLQRVVRYRNSAGLDLESHVVDMLSQVALHGAYHRGQIAVLLRNAGWEPIPTDFITFVRGVPAAVTPRVVT